jgi:hypothetical protein
MGESLKIQHGRVRLRLRNLTLDSAVSIYFGYTLWYKVALYNMVFWFYYNKGAYKCEISADRTFQTLQNGGNLSIMGNVKCKLMSFYYSKGQLTINPCVCII